MHRERKGIIGLKRLGFIVVLLAGSWLVLGAANEADRKAVLLEIDGPIGPAVADYFHRGLELAQQLGANRFFGDNLASIGEALVLQGEVMAGIEYLERAYRSSLESVPTHIAPFILSVLARVTPDEARRQQAIAV